MDLLIFLLFVVMAEFSSWLKRVEMNCKTELYLLREVNKQLEAQLPDRDIYWSVNGCEGKVKPCRN
jgi:hypothetical protein